MLRRLFPLFWTAFSLSATYSLYSINFTIWQMGLGYFQILFGIQVILILSNIFIWMLWSYNKVSLKEDGLLVKGFFSEQLIPHDEIKKVVPFGWFTYVGLRSNVFKTPRLTIAMPGFKELSISLMCRYGWKSNQPQEERTLKAAEVLWENVYRVRSIFMITGILSFPVLLVTPFHAGFTFLFVTGLLLLFAFREKISGFLSGLSIQQTGVWLIFFVLLAILQLGRNASEKTLPYFTPAFFIACGVVTSLVTTLFWLLAGKKQNFIRKPVMMIVVLISSAILSTSFVIFLDTAVPRSEVSVLKAKRLDQKYINRSYAVTFDYLSHSFRVDVSPSPWKPQFYPGKDSLYLQIHQTPLGLLVAEVIPPR